MNTRRADSAAAPANSHGVPLRDFVAERPDVAPPATSARWAWRSDVILVAVVSVLAAWTLAFGVHPSQDGGAHAHTAAMLRGWFSGDPVIREVFRWSCCRTSSRQR